MRTASALEGSKTTHNTRELVRTCAQHCARVYHVETESDVRGEWFEAAAIVGLTAGTSTPDEVIDRVEARIRENEAGRQRVSAAAEVQR